MRLNTSTLLLVGSALATNACNLVPELCTTEAKPAVAVSVRDSTTDAPAGRGARIVARDGAFADTAHVSSQYEGTYGLAHERPGSYEVTVEQQGYRVWRRSGVNVRDDECHVRTVSITARLQR